MKKKSGFSSKKVDESKLKKGRISVKIPESKKNDEFFDNQKIKQNLKSFYNSEAKKYAETRKKFWHEEKVILGAITPLFEGKEKVRILEFGCGSGRFATLLNQSFADRFDYVGVDLSEELLSYASKDNPSLTFFQGDITKLVKNFEQESFDLIVGTSSFQHIPTSKERSFLMKNFYRLLDYDGVLLMTNWSLSNWFIKKHWKIVMKAKIFSRFKGNSRDLIVPRTDESGKVYERFYHFFSLEELKNLANFAGFALKANIFIDGNGNFNDNERISRSSLLVTSKTPIID